MTNIPTRKRFLNMFIVVLLLVLLPLGSWYFLHKGYNFTKSNLSKLDSLGIADYDQLMNSTNFKKLENHIVYYAFPSGDKSFDQIQRLYTKFDDRDDLKFIMYLKENVAMEMLGDSSQVFFFEDHQHQEFQDLLPSRLGEDQLFMQDTKGVFRKKYDISNSDTVNQLFTQTVLLLPKD